MKPPATTINTRDDRHLAVCTWGNRDGTPVLWLHGTPGSRLSRHDDEEVYRDAGARVTTYDRPGYGLSSRHAERSVADVASGGGRGYAARGGCKRGWCAETR